MARPRPNIDWLPVAAADLLGVVEHIAERSGAVAAERFIDRVEKTSSRLASMPGVGTAWTRAGAPVAGLRHCAVDRHPNHILFYRAVEGGIEVYRLVHGARDLARLFPEDVGD